MATGSLAALKGKRVVYLMVRRSAVLDTSDDEKAILEEVNRAGTRASNFPRTYNTIARKLNKYMKENQSISAASDIAEAEFILFFNVLEIRRPLGYPYAFGELYVILNDKSDEGKARIVWRTRKSGMFAEDAIDEFINFLKDARGER